MDDAYILLARRLNELPNGFPSTQDGVELRLLEKLFTPEDARLAAGLRLELETPEEIKTRLGSDDPELRQKLKSMARQGLINVGKVDGSLGYGLLPFVVGIYEMQVSRLDEELAGLFEEYFQKGFGQILAIQPAVHRVIPVRESIRMDMEIHPYESAASIIGGAAAWGVLDCICRKQKMLVGDPCEHPLDVCLALSQTPGAFDNNSVIRALTQEQALETLHRAARAGLVHSSSNTRDGASYICNCCTCSCGILRGLAELGISNAVARSAFVNTVNEELCIACADCLPSCQFDALSLGEFIQVDRNHCVGCGVCILSCPEGALQLERRPDSEIMPVPADEHEWQVQRLENRELN